MVLSLGLSYSPFLDIDKFKTIKNLLLFARKLMLWLAHDRTSDEPPSEKLSLRKCKALRVLTLLYEESNQIDLINEINLDELLHIDADNPGSSNVFWKNWINYFQYILIRVLQHFSNVLFEQLKTFLMVYFPNPTLLGPSL